LTDREVDVLRLLATGMSDRQIGEALYISARTVTTHVSNLLGKTETANRTELALWAAQRGFVDPSAS
jgi:DNA-binding NarL/FixJ family response regulator